MDAKQVMNFAVNSYVQTNPLLNCHPEPYESSAHCHALIM
jgi:hypothetical protein